MFRIRLSPRAVADLRRLRRFDAVTIMDNIGRHLRFSPDRPARGRIKRLRGRQDATFRLRVGEHRVFYDVEGGDVLVVAVLHKTETAVFYRRGES